MGEAKRNKMLSTSDRIAERRAAIQGIFKRMELDYDEPGFFDQPNFLKAERKDPIKTLEAYCEWVAIRPRTAEYDENVRQVLPKLGRAITERLDREKWTVACTPISALVLRILEKMGIFSTMMRGSA